MPDFPSGIIAEWHASIATIPDGWFLCDGNNGTPDLRNKFIVGAGDSFNPGDTAGTINHAHPFTSNAHAHLLVSGDNIANGPGRDNLTSSETVTGNTDNSDGRPPFHALAYIMKS